MTRKGLIIILVLSLILAGLVGIAVGKYVEEQSFSGKVTFTAKLADRVILQEQTAQRQPDGSYQLQAPMVQENTYVLLPGLDIPKDPHIIIQGKTAIEAYLFLEVKNTLDTPVTYEMAPGWTLLADVTGSDGSQVYCYHVVIDETFNDTPIYILENNRITVSQNLRLQSADDGQDVLEFRALLIQKYEGATPAQHYLNFSN